MADVSGPGPVERGQLILVTAFGMAVLFVTLAMVLNTVIYTENLATRASDVAGGTEAVRYRDAVRAGIGGTVTHVNYDHNTSHEDLEANLSTAVTDWTAASGKQYAAVGRGANVSLAGTVNGTRIEQNNGTRNFTNVSTTATDWTLVTSVKRTREFRMNVSRSALDDLPVLGGTPYKLVVNDGTNTWTMNVSKDGTDIVVQVDGPTGGGSCSQTATNIWINVTEETVGGDECSALEFADGLSGDYSIAFENTENIEGTYTLVVDNPTLATSPGSHFDDDSGSAEPYVTPATYSAELSLVYQTPRLYYNTTVRVAPGEPDE